MRIEPVKVNQHIWVVVVLFVFFSSFFLIPALQASSLQTNWQVTFAEEATLFQTGKTVELHFLVENEHGHAIQNATVKAVIDRTETIHQIEKDFYQVQNGIYGTEVIFSVPGTWIVMLEIKSGKSYYRNQYLIEVEGPIIAKDRRDPADSFHLNQPLPNELERQLNGYPVFKKE